MTDVDVGSDSTIVAFDFDGTLTRRDSVVPFLAFATGWPRVALALAASSPDLRSRAQHRRDRAKAAVIKRCLAGRPIDQVADVGEEFAQRLLRRHLHEPVVERLTQHRQAGHRVILVSASLEIYLAPVARALGVEAEGVRLEVERGRLTGRLEGPNVQGEEKVVRLTQVLDRAPDQMTIVAYGNSQGDGALLDLAQTAYLVRRGRIGEYQGEFRSASD